MLIRDLYDYAVAHGLGLVPCEEKRIQNVLVLGRRGFVRVDPGVTVMIPIASRSAGTNPRVLHDVPEYVFGTIATSRDRASRRFDAFWARTREVLSLAGDDEALRAVAAAMADRRWIDSPAIRAIEKGWIALALDGDRSPMLARPGVVRQIRREFDSSMDAPGDAFCLVTGKSCVPVRVHDKIVTIPGTGKNGRAASAVLLSWNMKTAADGLEKGDNFPMSFRASKGWTAALNHIAAASCARFGDHVSMVFWGPASAHAIAKVVDRFSKRDDRIAAWAVVESLRDSEEPLHVACFKGSQSRIALLDYSVVPTKVVVERILRYRDHFAELMEEFESEPAVPSIAGNLASILSAKREFSDRAIMDATIGVLFDRPMPRGVIGALLHLLQPVDVVKRRRSALWAMRWLEWRDDESSGVTGPARRIIVEKKSSAEEPRIEDAVVVDNDVEAYHLGRLVALVDEIQYRSLRRRVGGNKAIVGLGRARQCPASYAAEFVRDFNVHAPNVGGTIVAITMETWQHLKGELSMRTTPLTQAEGGALTQGYMQQLSFNRRFSKYQSEVRKAKAAEKEKKAKAKEAAEEEASEKDAAE